MSRDDEEDGEFVLEMFLLCLFLIGCTVVATLGIERMIEEWHSEVETTTPSSTPSSTTSSTTTTTECVGRMCFFLLGKAIAR